MPARKPKMPRWAFAAVLVSGIVIIGYIVFRVIPPTEPPPDSCELMARQQAATLDVQATIQDLEIVKAKLGVSAGQVQDVDAILKDYAFRYEGSCRDHEAGRISTAEYNCKRDNMDRALAAARALSLTLAEVKNIPDASAQRDVVLKDIETIQQLAKNDFTAGCGSALVVTPETVTFEDSFPERTFEVNNRGNRDGAYTVTGLPEAFVAVRSSGPVTAGSGVVVSIKRTTFPPPGPAVVFYVNDNGGNRVAVKVAIDSNNAEMYETLGAQLNSGQRKSLAAPTVDDALAMVASRMPQVTDVATKYFVASAILQEAGSLDEAAKAVAEVSRHDKALYEAPATQMMQGVINFKLKRTGPALENFANADKRAAPGDTQVQTSAKAYAGAVLLSEGREQDAKQYLADPEVSVMIRRNQDLTKAVEKTLRLPKFSAEARAVVK